MQSAAFALSPSIPFHNSPFLRSRLSSNFAPSFHPTGTSKRLPPLSASVYNAACGLSGSALPRRSWPLSSSLKLRPWSGVQHFGSHIDTDRFEVRATSVPDSAGESEKSGSLAKTLELGLLFGLWYLFNIYFNIYNKQVCPSSLFPVVLLSHVQYSVILLLSISSRDPSYLSLFTCFVIGRVLSLFSLSNYNLS